MLQNNQQKLFDPLKELLSVYSQQLTKPVIPTISFNRTLSPQPTSAINNFSLLNLKTPDKSTKIEPQISEINNNEIDYNFPKTKTPKINPPIYFSRFI